MKCAICGKEIVGFGNNPWPVRTDENAECCDDCNSRFVIKYRILMDRLSFADKIPSVLNSKSYEELCEVE